jgi:hypothetical protein
LIFSRKDNNPFFEDIILFAASYQAKKERPRKPELSQA